MAAVVGAAIAIGAAAVLVGPQAVDREAGGVYRIRVGDQLDLYAHPDVRPTPSLAAAMVLIVVTGMCVTASRVASVPGERGRVHRFFVLSAAGAAFLGLDAIVGIHESIGLTIDHWIAAAPRPERLGHVVLSGYAVAACAYFWTYRDLLRRSPAALWLLGIAGGTSLVVALIDAVADDPSRLVTYPLQAASAAALLVGYWRLIEVLVIGRAR